MLEHRIQIMILSVHSVQNKHGSLSYDNIHWIVRVRRSLSQPRRLKEQKGVYLVLHFDNEEYELIHLAHAENIKDQIELSCSAYSSIPGNILIAVCYTPHSSLRAREKKVRDILAEFDDRNVDMHYDHLLTEIAV